MKPGSTIYNELAQLKSQDDRDRLALDYVRAGNVPSWTFHWQPIRAEIPGHVIEYYVMPDYLALGTDDDYFHPPLTAMAAQTFADENDGILPSTRISDEAYANASAHLIPQPIAGNEAYVSDWAKHEALIQKQMRTKGISPGTFMGGHKKDIVIGPNLDGSKVAIYGWHDASGSFAKGVPYAPIQPYSTIHGNYYADYAHGTRIARRRALLDGNEVDIYDVFTNPDLHALVAAESVPYKPRYPFKTPVGSYGGGGGIAKASIDRGVFSDAPPGTSPDLAQKALASFQKGDDVRAAQTTLKALGYDIGSSGPNHDGIDGVLGPTTTKVIQAFQKSVSLSPTGQLDAATKAKLEAKASVLAAYNRTAKLNMVFAAISIAGAAVLGGVVWWKVSLGRPHPTEWELAR